MVGEADDGEDAVRLAAELTPDVVLMDIRMPGLDGLSATRRIVADERTADVRVVLSPATAKTHVSRAMGKLRRGTGRSSW